jgi:two-component SAPR family response regulator
MLVDDNKIDNFFHERVILKNEATSHVIAMDSARNALSYLEGMKTMPNIIFLDINMPGMNGFEFISEYKKLDIGHKCLIVLMMNAHDDPENKALDAVQGIFYDFRPKPITKEILEVILGKYYS